MYHKIMELHGIAEFLSLYTLVFYETNYSIKIEYLPSKQMSYAPVLRGLLTSNYYTFQEVFFFMLGDPESFRDIAFSFLKSP